MKAINEIWDYREMIVSLVRKDLRGRYKGSVLGFLWTFLNPLLQLLVYTMVFSVILKNEIKDYYLFLFVALVPWMFFSVALTVGPKAILSQKDMVKKNYFPREVLPISTVTSSFINMLLTFIIIFIALFFSNIDINYLALLYLPIIFLLEYILVLGITFLTSAITVYFRDLEYILGILSMVWMYLTPIVYAIDTVPEKYRIIFYLNPMTSIITAYRKILYYGVLPSIGDLTYSFVFSVAILVVGWIVFEHLKKGFVEEL